MVSYPIVYLKFHKTPGNPNDYFWIEEREEGGGGWGREDLSKFTLKS